MRIAREARSLWDRWGEDANDWTVNLLAASLRADRQGSMLYGNE